MTDIAATEIVTGEIVPTDLSALEEIRSRDFTTAQVIEALTALALNGGSAGSTARMLKERGLDVGKDSLTRWRDQYPNRYQRLQRDLVPRIEEGLVPRYRDVAISAAEGAQEAIELERARIAGGNVKDAGKTAQQLALASAIGTDKMLTLTGRPDRIVSTPDAQQTLRAIAGRFGGLLVIDAADAPQRQESNEENIDQ